MPRPTSLFYLPRLAALRAKEMLTQQELAAKAEISRSALAAIEGGKSATAKTVRKLAQALNVSVEEFGPQQEKPAKEVEVAK